MLDAENIVNLISRLIDAKIAFYEARQGEFHWDYHADKEWIARLEKELQDALASKEITSNGSQ